MPNALEVFRKNVLLHLGERSRNWLAKEAGVNQASLNQFLNGEGNPSLKTVDALSKALNVSPAILFGGSDGKTFKVPHSLLVLLENRPQAVYEAITKMLEVMNASEEPKKSHKTSEKN